MKPTRPWLIIVTFLPGIIFVVLFSLLGSIEWVLSLGNSYVLFHVVGRYEDWLFYGKSYDSWIKEELSREAKSGQ